MNRERRTEAPGDPGAIASAVSIADPGAGGDLHRRSPVPRFAGSKGFSLIEVIVAVGLIATIFMVASARFDQIFARTRLEAGARGIADHFAYAIRSAYTAGAYRTLVFDLAANRYAIKFGRDTGESAQLLRRRLPTGVKFTDIQVGHEAYVPPGVLSIEVSPLGITNDVLVNLEDEQKQARAVWLQSLVQGVRYFDEYTSYEELQEAPE